MKNILPITAFLISAWIILLIPFQIIGYGFMPPDDAMRHSAKIISGKGWSQILVLRDEIKMDSYPGWHAVLKLVHELTGWDQHGLVLFSAVSLAVLFLIIPIFFLKFPESWLLAVFTLSLMAPGFVWRIFLGRPFIFTMASLLVILFMWPRLKNKRPQVINSCILIAIVALSVWIHASWYFFLFIAIAFALAREWRAAVLVAASSVIGIFIGAAFTGHPILFIKQMVTHLFLVFGSHDVERQLVSELRPMSGDFNSIIVVSAILGWKALRGVWSKKTVDNPVFILVAITFTLGMLSRRVWIDWGLPALAVWMAQEFDEYFKANIGTHSLKHAILVIAAASLLFISVTTDVSGRWSLTRPMDYISTEDPEQAKYLPGPGGIIYSDDMGVFYQVFYKNPKADWRYILGFESAFMPPEDLGILRNIQKNFSRPEDFGPWVKKMRPEDRLIVRGVPGSEPKIEGLKWHYIALNTWIGEKVKEGKK